MAANSGKPMVILFLTAIKKAWVKWGLCSFNLIVKEHAIYFVITAKRQTIKFVCIFVSLIYRQTLLEAINTSPPRNPGPQPQKHQRAAGFDHALFDDLVQGQGDSGGGGVAVFVDVVVNFTFGDFHGLLIKLVDAQVGLVGNEQIDVVQFQSGHCKGFMGDFRQPFQGVFENGLAVHVGVMLAVFEHLFVNPGHFP